MNERANPVLKMVRAGFLMYIIVLMETNEKYSYLKATKDIALARWFMDEPNINIESC